MFLCQGRRKPLRAYCAAFVRRTAHARRRRFRSSCFSGCSKRCYWLP